jgi:hypothetical protein
MILKSVLSVLAVTSTAAALSIIPLQLHHSIVGQRPSTALHLEDPRAREDDQLEGFLSKRDELKKASMASAAGRTGPASRRDLDRMGKDELEAYLASMGSSIKDDASTMLEEGGFNFKTKRVSPSGGGNRQRAGPPSVRSEEDDEEGERFEFMDFNDGFENENAFHIRNRIMFTTEDWADVSKGFVNGKLKKTDRRMGKFNKSDLKVSYICSIDLCLIV